MDVDYVGRLLALLRQSQVPVGDGLYRYPPGS